MHFHDVANDVLVGEVDEDQSGRFTRTQHLAQDTKEVFRTLCLETRVYRVNNLLFWLVRVYRMFFILSSLYCHFVSRRRARSHIAPNSRPKPMQVKGPPRAHSQAPVYTYRDP